MPFVPKKQAFNAHINEVVLGVGDKATAIGGQNVLPFHTFDAEIKNAPKIGVELTDLGMAEYTMPGEKAFYEGCTTVPEMAKRAESLEGASFICLHLEGADPNGLNKSVEECVQLAKDVADATTLPLVIMGCLYEYFGSVEKKQLRDELELAAVAVKENGTEYLSQLSSERYRLTWIENDGTVLYDTVTDAESLENHADRVEVKQALEYGEGESTRYSSTLLQKTMYCAERLADGSVLRISMSRATAGVLLVGMGQPILVVLIVALILSSVLAKSLSHRIVQPLNKLDLEHPLENDAYEELAPLLGRINRQHLQIDEQMDELQRQQTEFSQITSSMREGLVLLDEKEHVLSINPAAEKLFGTDESCVGQDFLTIDRSHDMSLAIERAMDEGHSEARVERGGRIWQFDVSRIGASGAAVGAVLLAYDITERERASKRYSKNCGTVYIPLFKNLGRNRNATNTSVIAAIHS